MGADLLYRIAVLALPREFRAAHGREMRLLVTERMHDTRARAGNVAAVGVFLSELADVVRTGFRLRQSAPRHGMSPSARRFGPGDFLREVRKRLRPGDGFLLGTDVVKPASILIPAYDDSLGVTAAFDLNLLSRMNQELDADFDLDRFEHRARWNASQRRVEMHLVARSAHQVRIRAADLGVTFRAGESIWTESSYKFDREEPRRMGLQTGFALERQWIEPEWAFAESLLIAR